MGEGWDGHERRKHPRINLKGELRGKIHTVADAPVVNLSIAGALLEVPCTLRVGAAYTVRLAVAPSQNLEIRARIVRSYVHGFDKNEKGETLIKYRAAVEFVALSNDQSRSLDEFLQRMEKVASIRAELQSERAV